MTEQQNNQLNTTTLPISEGQETTDTSKISKKSKIDDREKIRPGMIVSVYEKIKDTTPKGETRERVQVFKGMVLARKHGREQGATITVRKESGGIGVEKIFPVYSPIVERIVIEKQFKVRRSKLYFLRVSQKRLKEVK
jgi:large subunit ribosomal protein L19